jgi:predicted esterase
VRKNLSINRADKLDQIVVERNFRFEIIQTNEPITHVLFAFHGYGQLVTYFKRKFAALNLPNTLIVFPEGMPVSYTHLRAHETN